MRALAERAGTSISAAHYHFGSKDALLRAVLHRRIEPINARRLVRLRQCEASAAPGPASLEDLLDAFIRPSVEAWQAATEGSLRRARHIVAQLHADAQHCGRSSSARPWRISCVRLASRFPTAARPSSSSACSSWSGCWCTWSAVTFPWA